MSSVASLAAQFPHYLTNSKIFEEEKKVFEHKMFVLIFSTNLV
jgi:hypothetical protein